MNRNIILTTIFCAIATTGIAQKNITLTGTIENAPNANIQIINQSNNTPEYYFVKDVKTDAKGKFQVQIPTKYQLNNIIIAKDRTGAELLVPSKSMVDVTVNFSSSTPVIINENKNNEGIGINRKFAQQFKTIIQGLQQPQFTDLNDLETKLAVQVLESNRMIDSAFSTKTTKPYNEYYKAAVKYIQKTTQMTLFNNNNIMSNDSIKSVVLNNILNQKGEFNDADIYNPYYQNYVSNQPLVQIFVQRVLENNAANIDANMLKDAIEKAVATMPKQTASYASLNMINLVGNNFEQKDLINLYQIVSNNFKDENGTLAQTKIDNITKFNPGKKAIDFEFITRDGIKTKLSDYKGKVVYLDFWASWCGPCRQQMPAAKELKKHYEGKDVVFLYVSIDKDTASWESGINSMQIEGVHTLSQTWSGEIPKKYNISSIPAYFLIDKNGNFAERPARPSQKEEVIKQIDALLAQ